MIHNIQYLDSDIEETELNEHLTKVFMPGDCEKEAFEKVFQDVMSSMDTTGGSLRDFIHDLARNKVFDKTTNAVGDNIFHLSSSIHAAMAAVSAWLTGEGQMS